MITRSSSGLLFAGIYKRTELRMEEAESKEPSRMSETALNQYRTFDNKLPVLMTAMVHTISECV